MHTHTLTNTRTHTYTHAHTDTHRHTHTHTYTMQGSVDKWCRTLTTQTEANMYEAYTQTSHVTRMVHVTRMNGHVTRMNGSCHTYERVM